MRAQRASALSVPTPAGPGTVLAPRILPALAGTKGESNPGSPVAAKKSTRSKVPQKKKTIQRNSSVPKQKAAAKRTARVMSAARTKRTKKVPSSGANSSLPQLVLSDTLPVTPNDAERTVVTNAALAPILVMPEDGLVEPAPLAASETSAEHIQEEPDDSNESDAFVPEQMITEATAASPEQQTFLQALALQWAGLLRILTRTWTWTQQKLKSHQIRKRLRVCESVSLGEKRFIAVIQVDGEQFLVGGSSSSVSTLAHLEPLREFSDVLRNRCEQDLSQA
jgi:flagellar biogenesis protein FliO